jgi:hypothetical protein
MTITKVSNVLKEDRETRISPTSSSPLDEAWQKMKIKTIQFDGLLELSIIVSHLVRQM